MLCLLFFFLIREGRGLSLQSGDQQRIGDVVLRNFDAVTTDYYLKYVDSHSLILEKLETALAKDSRFAQIYREFEEQKVCYLPITTLLLKPMHRILHYELLLDSKKKSFLFILFYFMFFFCNMRLLHCS